ncbi:60S ribosomal protein L7-like isoform X2 [Rhagoletis pomonella]|uniref:60S ribosomal protein L7-like isoform X2 n=1 Tax=Rhagoletis pomonella TaxID=28610 RepID=UPI00178125E8|nr:60S ribosomal protein L7-like isoform X2 [Rhagoletis pomonella]
MLRIAESYITWGYPNLKSVRELIYKRGIVKHNHQRGPICDNVVIERKLHKAHDIKCDPTSRKHPTTCGHSSSTPTGGWRKRANHYVEVGDFGNREDKINKLHAQDGLKKFFGVLGLTHKYAKWKAAYIDDFLNNVGIPLPSLTMHPGLHLPSMKIFHEAFQN